MTTLSPKSRLVSAIQEQRLGDEARKLLAASGSLTSEDKDLCTQALATLHKIGDTVERGRAELCDAMALAKLSVVSDGTVQEPQFHEVVLDVNRAQLSEAISAAEALGYSAPFRLGPGQIRGLQLFVNEIRLTRSAEVDMRVRLRFTPACKRILPRKLQPTVLDLAQATLPPGLAATYVGVRAGRIASELLGRQRVTVSDSETLGTPSSLILPILDAAGCRKEDTFLDIGCGDGRVICTAAEHFGVRAIGVESNPLLFEAARARAAASDARRLIHVHHQDAADAPLDDATLIFMFLPPSLLARFLQPVLERMSPNARLVAHEQIAVRNVPPPDVALPVIAPESLTVARIWSGRSTT